MISLLCTTKHINKNLHSVPEQIAPEKKSPDVWTTPYVCDYIQSHTLYLFHAKKPQKIALCLKRIINDIGSLALRNL